MLLFKGKGNGCCVVGLVGGEEGPAATFGVMATGAVVGMAAVVVWKHWFYQRWSNLQSRFTVAMMFWRVGTIPSTAVMCCCSRVRGLGVDGTCVVGGEEGPVAAFGVMVTGMAAVIV